MRLLGFQALMRSPFSGEPSPPAMLLGPSCLLGLRSLSNAKVFSCSSMLPRCFRHSGRKSKGARQRRLLSLASGSEALRS